MKFTRVLSGCQYRNLVNVLGGGRGKNIIFSNLPPPPPPVQLLTTTTRFMVTSTNAHADADMAAVAMAKKNIFPSSYGDPCLDLFFNVTPPADLYSRDDTEHAATSQQNSRTLSYLYQQLPVAWSQNSLTTLKVIFSLVSFPKFYVDAFNTALFWLHQNHPKTLARNVDAIPGNFGSLYTLVQFLYILLLPEDEQQPGLAHKAAAAAHPERYEHDPDYKFLHDRVMDVFVERLKSDIQKMKQHKLKLKPSDYSLTDEDDDDSSDDDDDDDDEPLDADAYADLFVSVAADCCLAKHPSDVHTNRAISLRESIAKRLFPPQSDQSEEDQWEQLTKEVLAPLKKYYNRQGLPSKLRLSVAKKYLEDVKLAAAAGAAGGVIKPDALLPHQILDFVEDGDVVEAAELQWKELVQTLKEKGKFKNCLAVCDMERLMGEGTRRRSASLGLLVSQLSDEPAWKDKVISSGPLSPDCLLHLPQNSRDDRWPRPPHLYSILDGDLKSKFSFMMRIDTGMLINLKTVFDFVLQVAVNENLKPEQMIKKLFVFTLHINSGFYDSCAWETEYEAIRSRFKEKGFGDDSVPHILFWDIWNFGSPSIIWSRPGMTLLRGWSANLVKSFCDNGGDFTPHRFMEAAIADEKYQTLTVVD